MHQNFFILCTVLNIFLGRCSWTIEAVGGREKGLCHFLINRIAGVLNIPALTFIAIERCA